MRFLHITLAVAICLFVDSALGTPTKGRYMWVKCNPNAKSPNCVTRKGPVIPLAGQRSRLPPSAAKDIVPVVEEEADSKMEEQSGDGSGDSDNNYQFLSHRSARDVMKTEEEGSTTGSGDIDYSEYISPQKIHVLSKDDLQEDNIIA